LPKTEFTSFDVAAVVRELKETIRDARVNNVYQLDNKTLMLTLHKTGTPLLRLIGEAGERLHLTSYVLEKPTAPPPFAMALRKHLRGALMTSIEQYEFERIVILNLKSGQRSFRLILELFGDGNVILVGEDGPILQALTYKRMRDRNILRGEMFKFPPSGGKNPLTMSEEQFTKGIEGFGDVEVVRALARFVGLGGLYSEEVLLRVGVEKAKPCNALDQSEWRTILEKLKILLASVTSEPLDPCIVVDESGAFADVVPFKLKRYLDMSCQKHATFNEALDEFYTHALAVRKAVAGKDIGRLKAEADRLRRVVEEQEKMVADVTRKAESDRRIGDLIRARVGEIQVLLDKFVTDRGVGKHWEKTVADIIAEKNKGSTPWRFFDSYDPKTSVINVNVDGLKFSLEARKNAFENAARYYERAKRFKQKLTGTKSALEESSKKLQEIEAKKLEVEDLQKTRPAEAIREIAERKVKRKEWFEKFRWFETSDGLLVVAGKDAVSNEVLIKKHTDENDVVFHADIAGAPFAVVKTGAKKPSEQSLREAAEFAASFSKAWREGFTSVDVYWVKPGQLSKSAPSGEYVTHGAFVVRGERNWIRGAPLGVAVGVLQEGDDIRFVGGPLDAVKAKTSSYVIVVPDDQGGKSLFNAILYTLASKLPKNVQTRISKLSIEDMRELIPYGRGRIAS
jgi:predicted ribosome quality control (RQC) complex YloA/Tae2 family protein